MFFFQTAFQRSFFEGPCADLNPKVRFLTDFGPQLGSKMAPWSAIFDQKGDRFRWHRRTGSLLEPTWAPFGAENGPRTYFSRFGTVFGWFLKDFRWNLKDFHGFPTYFGHDFCQNFGIYISSFFFFKKRQTTTPRSKKIHQIHKPQPRNPAVHYSKILARRNARKRLIRRPRRRRGAVRAEWTL